MIYNCTPPEKNKPNIDKDLEYHRKIIRATNPEFVGVYDIISEKSRNGCERPYPHRDHMNAFEFAERLASVVRSDLAVPCGSGLVSVETDIRFIVYRSVKPNETYDDIVQDIKNHQMQFGKIVIVGNSENPNVKTNQLIRRVLSESTVEVGCVLLPERKNEMDIFLERVRIGVSFFISQIVIRPEQIRPFLDLLSDSPIRIWTTIIPMLNEKTVDMYNWLNGTNDVINLTEYPNELLDAKIQDLCFEAISYVPPSRMIQFIERFTVSLSAESATD